jgi:hypothetical protein
MIKKTNTQATPKINTECMEVNKIEKSRILWHTKIQLRQTVNSISVSFKEL